MLYIGHLLPTNFRIKQFGACKIEGAYLARSFGRFEPIDIGGSRIEGGCHQHTPSAARRFTDGEAGGRAVGLFRPDFSRSGGRATRGHPTKKKVGMQTSPNGWFILF